MRIPTNMTEAEVLKIIEEVSNRYAYKFRFGFYDVDDIKQEAFLLALDGLERYEEGQPLENFLAKHVRNRLISFVRDNYYRREPNMSDKGVRINEVKKALIDTIDITQVDMDNERNMIDLFNVVDHLSKKEICDIIDRKVDPQLREDYLRFKDGDKLTKSRKDRITNHILEIIEEHGKDFTW